jgi:hypothetical protein
MDESFKFDPITIKSKPLIIYEKRWYYRLVEYKYKKTKSLMDDYDLNKISNHLVICYNTSKSKLNKFYNNNSYNNSYNNNSYNNNDYDVRIYAFFDTYDEFLSYLHNFNDIKERNFFEVIFGEFKQKPHFDIDIDIKNISKYNEPFDVLADKILNILINTCIEILKTVNVEINIEEDILIYSSHSDNKRSFHLILNNVCHDCNLEAKAFYDIVINHIKLNHNNKFNKSFLIEFIDKNVYSSKQQFRTLGSQKLNSDRPKIFHEQFTINNINYNHVYKNNLYLNQLNKQSYIRLCESMVTHTFDCKLLPSFMTNKIYTQSITQSITIDINYELADKCMNMLFDKFKSLNIICPFTLKNCKNNIIILQRNNSSYCPLCSRIHENQHPFMFITYGKLYWDCRRYNQDKFFIGYIDIDLYNITSNNNNSNNNNSNNNNSNNNNSNNITSNTSNIMIGDFDLGLPNNNDNNNNDNLKCDNNNNDNNNNDNLKCDNNNNDNLKCDNNDNIKKIPKIETRLTNIKSKIKRTSIEFFNKKNNSKYL